MIAACIEREREKCDWKVFVTGVLQMITGVFILGWIWSIVWGVQIYQKSKPKVQVVYIDSVTKAELA